MTFPASPLVASRALGVLDELRVPYDVDPEWGDDSAWASVSAGSQSRALHWWAGARALEPGRYSLDGIPVWGCVAPDQSVAAFAETLEGAWAPGLQVLGADGRRYSSVWRSSDGGAILPFDPDELVLNFRSERYSELQAPAGSAAKAAARRVYYALRPLMPRRLQIGLRRAFARVQARAEFPRWPVEPALHDLVELVLRLLADAAGEPIPYLAPWPRGYDWAFVLTHDVETAAGRDAIERVRAVEEEAGFRSSWNLVPERYAVGDELVRHLGRAGCEVGVHGLRHDGRDLESLRTLRRRLPEIRRWAERWGAVGFRAPATHRVWDWMPMLGFDYDSSYPDTDLYEPISGGCCSWLPFFNQDLVELPITLPQDHTVFVILRRDESLWLEKAEHLRRHGGMALLITHPDYMLEDEPLRAYARLLDAYRDDAGAWKALPRDVSAWWRRRAETSLVRAGAGWRAVGPAADEASIAFVHPDERERATLSDGPVVATARAG
jgi:hypothetical protein